MEVAICLLATAVSTWVLRKPIAKAPWVFYLVAALLSLAYGTGAIAHVSYHASMALAPVLRRCQLAFSLFAIVMFIGVLPEGSKVRTQLVPVRGNLAIIAALLAACHIVTYGRPYLAKVGLAFGGLNSATYVALGFALVLVVLLVLLTATSVMAVRTRMEAATWKKVQLLAYAFFPLVAVHALLMIGPAALSGGRSGANAIAYLCIVVAYIVLRLVRHLRG